MLTVLFSKTERIRMLKDHVVHRTPMNDQFIPHYDSASSTWMEMLDKGTILYHGYRFRC